MERSFDELLNDCVHCGFCLPACPTYQLWGEEMDSPRGRIHLMRGLAEGDVLTPERVGHFDACLGCMACVPACPSGVQYDKLIETTRARIEPSAPRTVADRGVRTLIFTIFPYPRRIRAALPLLRLAQRTGLQRALARQPRLQRRFPRLLAMTTLAPAIPRRSQRRRAIGGPAQAAVPTRGTVAVLTGCVQDAFFSRVNRDTVSVLRAEGFDVIVPKGQGCCGALGLHTGREERARAMAAELVDRIPDRVDAIITNAAGCGSSLKEYGDLLADDPVRAERAARFAAKVRDITEFLIEVGPVAPRHPVPLTVAYHDACHLAHAQGVRRPPRELLAGIPELTLVEITEGDLCCGSAGVYNILNPAPAADLGARKARNVAATGAHLLVAGNPGCLMQIQQHLAAAGQPMPAMHTIELLATSLDPTRQR